MERISNEQKDELQQDLYCLIVTLVTINPDLYDVFYYDCFAKELNLEQAVNLIESLDDEVHVVLVKNTLSHWYKLSPNELADYEDPALS